MSSVHVTVDELENRLLAKRSYLRFMSHEVRNPLNSVVLGLNLIFAEMQVAYSTSLNCEHKKQMNEEYLSEESTEYDYQSADEDNIFVEDGDELTSQASSNHHYYPTPLSMECCLETLKQNTASWLEMTSDLLENATNAVVVLNDMLQYDKIESKTMTIEIQPITIDSVIKKAVSGFQLQAKAKMISLTLIPNETTMNSHDVHTLNVLGDEVRIAQVLRNFLSNAVKFTPMDGTISVQGDNNASILP